MSPLVLLVVKIKKNREENICIKKKCYKEKHVDLLLMGEVGKSDCFYQRF